jgi:PBP1b-binding outer membrane lipoprotein LpoB
MTERLREVLFNSGKVRFTTYVAGEGQSFDEATAYARELQNDPNVNQRTVMKKGKVNAYDLSLAGVIIKQTARDGRANEISYMFSLTLTDNNTGEGVWAYTKELKRQHVQGGFGW